MLHGAIDMKMKALQQDPESIECVDDSPVGVGKQRESRGRRAKRKKGVAEKRQCGTEGCTHGVWHESLVWYAAARVQDLRVSDT